MTDIGKTHCPVTPDLTGWRADTYEPDDADDGATTMPGHTLIDEDEGTATFIPTPKDTP